MKTVKLLRFEEIGGTRWLEVPPDDSRINQAAGRPEICGYRYRGTRTRVVEHAPAAPVVEHAPAAAKKGKRK